MNEKTQSMLQDGYYLVAKIVNGMVMPLWAEQPAMEAPKEELTKEEPKSFTWLRLRNAAKTFGCDCSILVNLARSDDYKDYFSIKKGAYVVRSDFKLPENTDAYANSHCNAIQVKCKETGVTFKSINAACRSVGLTYHEIKKSLMTGNKCGGYHFTYAT